MNYWAYWIMTYLLSGNLSKKTNGPVTKTTTSAINKTLCNINADQQTDKIIVNKAIRLAFRGILRDFCQFKINGPKVLLVKRRRCISGEDLAKQAAATNKKGVVGKMGSTTPKIAKPTNSIPVILNINTLSLLYY